MTYRMFLIGQIASGFYMSELLPKPGIAAIRITDAADAIIARLDAEAQSRAEAQAELAKDRRTEPTR